MAKSRPSKLVIDASIGCQANKTDERSIQCEDFLTAVRNNDHAIIMTGEIHAEWHRHPSRFGRKWLTSMFARHRVIPKDLKANKDFRKHIKRIAPDGFISAIMLKDCHLIESALATENRIASLDDQARHHFRQAAVHVHLLQGVCWVNPCVVSEQPIGWLRQGAPLDNHRLLGFAPKSRK